LKKRIDNAKDAAEQSEQISLAEEPDKNEADETSEQTPDMAAVSETAKNSGESRKLTRIPGKTGKYSVTVYLCFLFAAVLLLILVSYFIQQRNNVNTINSLTESHNEFSSQAMENIQKLQEENVGYLQQITDLQSQIDKLQSDKSDDEDKITELQTEIKNLTEESEQNKGKSDALTALFIMEKAVDDDDTATANAEAAVIEPLKQYLSTDELATYQQLLKKIG